MNEASSIGSNLTENFISNHKIDPTPKPDRSRINSLIDLDTDEV